MKKLLCLLIMLPTFSFALTCGETKSEVTETKTEQEVETVVPAHLKGATLTITLANGSKEVVKAEEYMLVKRKHKRPVVRVSSKETTLACETKVVDTSKKNIISVQAVRSQSGLSKDIIDPTTVEVETKSKVGAGVMYQRKFDDLVIGVGADTNKGVNLGVGLEF